MLKNLINNWATLTNEELNIYTINSPILVKDNKLYQEIISNEEWQPQGYIPTPKNKFEWFRHDIFHGVLFPFRVWSLPSFPGRRELLRLRRSCTNHGSLGLWRRSRCRQ